MSLLKFRSLIIRAGSVGIDDAFDFASQTSSLYGPVTTVEGLEEGCRYLREFPRLFNIIFTIHHQWRGAGRQQLMALIPRSRHDVFFAALIYESLEHRPLHDLCLDQPDELGRGWTTPVVNCSLSGWQDSLWSHLRDHLRWATCNRIAAT